MAIEPKRGCGYRKVGGLYMVGGKLGAPCCKMPIPLHVCPTCSQGVKQTRGWTWIDPRPFIGGACTSRSAWPCPVQDFQGTGLGDRVGLLWIGERFYPTPEHFAAEAGTHGISRRIIAIPRGFKLGESWVFLAHPKACTIEGKPGPGIFRIFKPTSIEKIVTATQATDAEAMAELAKKGVTPVVVPDDDRDHTGTVYDDDVEDVAPANELPGLRPQS